MFVHHPKGWVKASMRRLLFCCISLLIACTHYTHQTGCTSGLLSVTFSVYMHLPFSFLSALFSKLAVCVGS